MGGFFLESIYQAIIGIALSVIIAALFSIWSKVKELHVWHDKEDEQGVKVWYTKNRTMEDSLAKLVDICDRMDRREERSALIQNETIKVMQEHTITVGKLVAVVEALVVMTKRNGSGK